MNKVVIDKHKCIRCGQCIKDCIMYSLERDGENYPQPVDDKVNLCISCQHCFAICPVGAITFEGHKPSEAQEAENTNPDEILKLIKNRRSIRQFKSEEISEEVFQKLKDMLPYIPTGCNYNSLHFSIIETKSAMDEIRNYTNNSLIKLISNKFTARCAGKLQKFTSAIANGEDVIYRGALHLIIVSADIKAPCTNVDPIIALSYIELYAKSLGLGTCWCGFAQACLKMFPQIAVMVGVPEGYKPVYAMLIGYPDVNYKRNPIPKEFPISSIKEISNKKPSRLSILKRIITNFIR